MFTRFPSNGLSYHLKTGSGKVELADMVTAPGPQVVPFVVAGPGGFVVRVMITSSRLPSQLVSEMATYSETDSVTLKVNGEPDPMEVPPLGLEYHLYC